MEGDLHALMVEQSPDVLVALGRDRAVLLWNHSAERVFGYPAAEAVGRPLVELIAPAGSDGLADDLVRAADGHTVQGESMLSRRDGALIYVHATLRATRDAGGRVDRYFCSMSDITAQRVRRDSQQVRKRYHDVLESAPDAIVIVNDSGRIVLFNARAREMFGHDAESVIGEPIEMLLPPRLRRAHVGHRTAFIREPRMRPMGAGLELHGLRHDGAEFPVEISLSPIESDAGRMVMSAIRDISERKRIERTLHEKNVELERASKAKDHFLATMSHELRTPLNAIIGFTGLLLMKLPGPLNPTQERQLQLVQSSGNHLLSLINDLLDLAKIESGRVELRSESVPCAEVVDHVAATLRLTAQAKGLRLDVALPPVPLFARADRRAMQQIVLNLASNAVKFTSQGSVRIAAAPIDRGGEPAVEVSVTDTGIGISRADLERLFQAFTQVGDPKWHRPEGTGLGLYLSRKLAALMGGSIGVDSRPGEGSRFTLTLARER